MDLITAVYKLSAVIDGYIEDHENDSGSISQMENNQQTMHTLAAFSSILSEFEQELRRCEVTQRNG